MNLAAVGDDGSVALGPPLHRRNQGLAIGGTWMSTASDTGAVVPDGGVDVIWTPGRTPWIAGPDTKPSSSTVAPGALVVGVRLGPGALSALIGAGASAVADQRIALDSVVSGRAARSIDARLHAADPPDASQVLADLVEDLVGLGWEPDPVVLHELARIHSKQPFNDDLSRRQVRRRFTDAMGYGPKFYERIVRLDRFSSIVAARPSMSLAESAHLAGFHDQAHLSRNARQLVGETPAALAGRSRRTTP